MSTDNAVKPVAAVRDAAFADEVKAFIKKLGLSQKQVARKIGVSGSYLSWYFSDAEFKHWQKVEPKLRQWYARTKADADANRSDQSLDTQTEYIATDVSEEVCRLIDHAKATGDVIVIYGPGGIGKTKGLDRSLENDLASIVIRSSPHTGEREQGFVSKRIIKAYGVVKVEGREPKLSDAKERALEGQRPLIADDAHYLHRNAIESFVRFCRDTKSAGVLIGNYELLAKINALNDQTESRVGMRYEVRAEYLPAADADATQPGYRREHIAAFVRQFIDAPPAALITAAAKLATQRGHLRRLEIALGHLANVQASGEDLLDCWHEITANLGVSANQ